MQVKDEKDLVAAIGDASGPLVIKGGGTRGIGDPVVGSDLNISGLRGVRIYEPGALTLVVRAGTPLAEVEALLASQGQRLAFEPMDHRRLLGRDGVATIGGMVAANISGPRRISVGACRDFLLGARFVDGLGQVIKNGGRVMKNVTGYDLVRLMAGSFGTLGVLCEVSLKVLPAPESAANLRIRDLADDVAIRVLSAAMGSPFDVTGAAHGPEGTILRLEGFGASVRYRAEKLAVRLAEFGAVEIETESGIVADIWRDVRDVGAFHDQTGDVWRISIKPSDGATVAARLRAAFDAEVRFDWAGGLVWALLPAGSDARAALAGIGGHARIERAAPETRLRLGSFPREGAVIERISAGIRARFDPRGILNPGRMGDRGQ